MKLEFFNNGDIALVTGMSTYQMELIEDMYPVLYHEDGFYIPGDCGSDLVEEFECEVIKS